MVTKMDMNNRKSVDLWLASTDIWLQSLGLLFRACDPLTYNCRRTREERASIIEDISNHTYYCQSVRDAIETDARPMTWDEWNELHQKDVVEGKPAYLDYIDHQEFGNVLTTIFNGMDVYPQRK